MCVFGSAVRAETLDYELFWGALPVGSARLLTERGPQVQGTPTVRTVLTVRTNSFIDLFVKVRDRIEGLAAADYSRSYYYEKSVHEGSVRRSFATVFDWNATCAVYTPAAGAVQKVRLAKGTLDPLSVFFGLRTLFDPGQGAQRAWTADGKRLSRLTAMAAGRERLLVDYGEYNATVVDVRMPNIDGVFRTGGDGRFRIWLSPDARKLPVKIAAGVIVAGIEGAMTAELESVGEPQ